MARFARCGGEVLAIAIRIARAAAGRDKIAFCGYHGWQDWYLAANLAADDTLDGHLLRGLEPAGVPRGLRASIVPFNYNDLDALEKVVADHPGQIAAIVMEPTRSSGPAPGFLEGVRAIATRIGAALVFDEVTSGWRLNTGGVHMTYGVEPDLATFAKALGNGYPMSAVIGRRSVMEAAQHTFISSTAWTERIGPTAALAMIRKHRRLNAAEHLVRIGARVQKGWQSHASTAGLKVHVSGMPPLAHLEFEGEKGTALATLFIQSMLDRGYLTALSFYSTYAHQDHHVDTYLKAVGEVFGELAAALAADEVEQKLRGPLKHSGFQRLA
jgi:glutamate-1-semialdehyde 2,1-aminomutase